MSDHKCRGKGNSKKQDKFQMDEVTQSLSKEYTDPKKLYLPSGKACSLAKEFKYISNYQLRKILDIVKLAVRQSNNDFAGARKQMFVLVAMSAYNAGRLEELKPLYIFMQKTITEKTIREPKDIDVFDQLFTSIIAYHSVIGGRK